MPATYAHWRFGNQCITALPEALQTVINRNRQVYNFGVQGPDIFFYYKVFKYNEVNDFGYQMHWIPFKDTLAKIKENYKKAKDRKASLAYILGFTAHFTLDSYCHSFIQKKIEAGPYSHLRLETQFEKELLVMDGFNPIKKKAIFSLKPSWHTAEVINNLFPVFNQKIIDKALKDMRLYLSILKDSNKLKRKINLMILNKAGANKYADLMMMDKEFEGMKAPMTRLKKYYDKALEHYPKLAVNVYEYLENDRPLDKYFRHILDYEEGYKDIPILSIEDEMKYKVTLKD